jgi:general secretion pathway protein M
MSASSSIARALTKSPLIAVTLYLAVVAGLIATAGFAIADVVAHQRALAQTSDLLDQLQGRRARSGPALASGRSGTPFLEGPTVTVAGAALLQRVGAAVSSAGAPSSPRRSTCRARRPRRGWSGSW